MAGGTQDYEGVVEKRHSTDKIFLLLIIAMWIAMTIVGIQGIQSGNPYRLISPIDDKGRMCGVTDSVKNQKYFYSVLTTGVGVCIDTNVGCPTNTSSFASVDPNDYYCLDYIDGTFTSSAALSTYISTTCFDNGVFSIPSNCGCMLKLASTDFLQRCSFKNQDYANKFVTQALRNQAFKWISDIYQGQAIIFGYGIGFSVFASFLFIACLRFYWLSTIVIWTMLIAVLACFAGVCGLAYTTAHKWDIAVPREHSNDEILALKVTSVLFMALAIIWAIMMIIARSSVQVSVKMMSLTAEAMEDMPLIVLTPLLKVTGYVVFLWPWIIYVFFIASSGTFKTVDYVNGPITYSYVKYSLSQDSQGRLWFMLFCYLWSTEFIMAIGTLFIAIAVANWYFSHPSDRTMKGGSRDLGLGIWHTIRYHLGTAAFGSLVIAIITFIRAVVLYLQKQYKKVAGDNMLTKCLFCCVNCCLWCLEACIRYIVQNAYIQTAIHGYSLCYAGKEAFFLIARNPLRVFLLDMLAGLAMGLAKIMIVSICGAGAYYIFTQYYIDHLTGLIAPTIFTMIVSFTVVSAFSSVFHSMCETMIQCFITDEENNNGTPVYSSTNFKKFVDETAITPEQYEKLSGNTVEETQRLAEGSKTVLTPRQQTTANSGV